MAERKESLVAFLAVRTTQDGEGYLGGVLVTDETGVPKEFRCTHPIRPTVTQKALYGANLLPHIFIHLIGLPLIRSLTTNPLFCSVSEPILLRMRDDVDLPIFHFERLGDVMEVGDPGLDRSELVSASKRIDSERGGFQPISATCHHGHESDLEALSGDLHQVSNDIDLLEPFTRIVTAINALSARDERFR